MQRETFPQQTHPVHLGNPPFLQDNSLKLSFPDPKIFFPNELQAEPPEGFNVWPKSAAFLVLSLVDRHEENPFL